MKLTVLGSGSSVPHPKRSSAGFWLETDGGSLLLDCSASAIHRMAQENLDWANLDAIWISHFHLDHCGGLAPFLFATKHAPDTQSRTKPLRIFGGEGLGKLIETFDSADGYDLLKQPFPVEIVEIAEKERFETFPGLEATALSTPHKDESHALRLRDNRGKMLVYTSDTGFFEDLATFAGGVDLLVIECSFVKNKPVQKHLELVDVMKIAFEAGPKRMMLTHFYPEWDNVDFNEEVRRFSVKCEIIEAVDGLRVDV